MKTYPSFACLRTSYVWQYLQTYLMCEVLQLVNVLVAFVEWIMPTHHLFLWWLWGSLSLSFKVVLYFLKDSHIYIYIGDGG